MEILIRYLPDWALPYVYKIMPQQWLYLAYGGAVLLMLLGLVGTIYGTLRALGWRRYQGTWYSPEQFLQIVQELYTGVRDGRVPDYETMKILDEYIYGRNGSHIRNLTRSDY